MSWLWIILALIVGVVIGVVVINWAIMEGFKGIWK